jgi:hypothetical protein
MLFEPHEGRHALWILGEVVGDVMSDVIDYGEML